MQSEDQTNSRLEDSTIIIHCHQRLKNVNMYILKNCSFIVDIESLHPNNIEQQAILCIYIFFCKLSTYLYRTIILCVQSYFAENLPLFHIQSNYFNVDFMKLHQTFELTQKSLKRAYIYIQCKIQNKFCSLPQSLLNIIFHS